MWASVSILSGSLTWVTSQQPHLCRDLPFFSADTCFGKLLSLLFESLFRPLVFCRRPASGVSPDLGIRFHHFRCSRSTVTRKQMGLLLTQRPKVSGNRARCPRPRHGPQCVSWLGRRQKKGESSTLIFHCCSSAVPSVQVKLGHRRLSGEKCVLYRRSGSICGFGCWLGSLSVFPAVRGGGTTLLVWGKKSEEACPVRWEVQAQGRAALAGSAAGLAEAVRLPAGGPFPGSGAHGPGLQPRGFELCLRASGLCLLLLCASVR